jgi:hypothetical protein
MIYFIFINREIIKKITYEILNYFTYIALAQHGGLWDETRIDERDEEGGKNHVEDLPSRLD